MKAYIRHLVAMFATFFGSQAAMTPGAFAQDQDAQEWAAAKSEGTLKALEDYLARHPVGPYSREAFREIIRLSNGGSDDIDKALRCEDIVDGDPLLSDNAYCAVGALY